MGAHEMRRLTVAFVALLISTSFGQAATPEATNSLLAKMEWLKSSHQYGGACIRIHSSQIVVIDPAGISAKECQTKADVIIVTHNHDDHFSPEAVAALRSPSTRLVAPAAVAKEVASHHDLEGLEVITAEVGHQLSMKGIAIDPVPAYSLVSKAHPQANAWLGYVLTIDGVRIYCTGDSSLTPVMRRLKDIDIVIANIRQPYQLGREEAIELAKALKPQVLVPVHWLESEKGDVDFIVRRTLAPTRVVLLGGR
jgi:L-ascorbate metabolism protein UlaG (beta-lactamase superfamily)